MKSKRTKDLLSVASEPESGIVSHKAQIHINESLRPYKRRLFGRVLQFKRSLACEQALCLGRGRGEKIARRGRASPSDFYPFPKQNLFGRLNGKVLLEKSETSTTKSSVTHEEFAEFLDQCN